MKGLISLFLAAFFTITAALHAGNLKVTITPAQAVTAGAQWRVDGGVWRSSGITVKNLTNTSHSVEFSSTPGWITPASTSVTLSGNNTASVTGTYVQAASLTLNLVPAGQWRIDGGAWRNSGTAANDLAPGNHSVEFGTVNGYTTPPAETVALVSGQALSLSRTYAAQARITVVLSPGAAQWRVNGAEWRQSGTSVFMDAGTYTVGYSHVTDYADLSSESVTLTAGQSVSLTRAYTSTPATIAMSALGANGAGRWRVDGGTWTVGNFSVSASSGSHTIEYLPVSGYTAPATETVTLAERQSLSLTRSYTPLSGSLSIKLSQASGRWRVDTGAWQVSDAVLQVTPGTHAVEYSHVTDYGEPTSESVTITAGQAVTLTRFYSYTPAAITMSALGASGAGRWRVDAGPWLTGSSSASVSSGSHTIEYLPVSGYTPPATETVTLAERQSLSLSRSYTPLFGFLTVRLLPTAGRWRVDTGAWQVSDTTLQVTAGSHTIEYSHVTDYADLASESATVAAGQAVSLTRSYTYTPATIVMSALGANGAGRWRVDAGSWMTGNLASSFPSGTHTIEYLPVNGYTAPATETVTLAERQLISLNRSYTPVFTSLSIKLSQAAGRWRVDAGTWQLSDATLQVTPGVHAIEYSHITDYNLPGESLTIAEGQSLSLLRSYAYSPATISMSALGANGAGRWRIDGGEWLQGSLAFPVASGSHSIEYLAVTGYTAPASETVTLAEQQPLALNRSYTALPSSITVSLTPAIGRWRIDSCDWQASGAVVSALAGTYKVEYEHLDFHIRPENETVNVAGATSLSRVYAAGAGDFIVHPNPPLLAERGVAQWRIDAGPWRTCGSRYGVLPGTHTLEFKPASGLDIPPASQITVTAGELLEMEADFFMVHRLRFFIKEDLAAGLTPAELQSRLSQYAAHLQTIWHRESARRFTFNPATDITVCTQDPFSWNYTGNDLPELGFEVWIYASLTDNSVYGSYGGDAGLDLSGAGGATSLKWDSIHDPASLQSGTPELRQYWTQLNNITHEVEHSLGAGIGEYYSLATIPDPTGIAPILPTVSFSTPDSTDPFWGTRQEYWADPLLTNLANSPRWNTSMSLAELLQTVQFAPATKGVINNLCRRTTEVSSLSDLGHVKIRVIDSTTGLPIPGATCRAWNRTADYAPEEFEQVVIPTANSGEFEFQWTPFPTFSPLLDHTNAKIIKAWAPGYKPAAQWESIYDAQKARTWDLKSTFEITVALTPE